MPNRTDPRPLRNESLADFGHPPEAFSTSIAEEVEHYLPGGPPAMSRRGLGVARLLVVLVCLALLGSSGWLIWRSRAEVVDQAVQANTNLARAVTERVEGLVAEADHIVASVLFELERYDITPARLLELQPMLVREITEVEHLKGLFVYDAQGRWIASSEPVWPVNANNSDRPYFIHHRDNASTRAAIGAPLISRSSGEWILPVSRRINDPDGQFVGVVLATVRIEYLRQLLDRFDMGRDGAITLRVPQGIIVRTPHIATEMGQPMQPSPLKTLFEGSQGGSVDALSTLDGVRRLLSFQHARNYPILVVVAKSKADVLRDWRYASVLQAAWACFLCGVLAFAGHHARAAMRRQWQAEDGLRKSNDALALAHARLAVLVRHDGLTGLANRRHFDQQLARLFQLAQREQRAISLVMIDVDEFKRFNDRYGHVEGDDCLQRVAAALREVTNRPADLVARYGGEEMVMLLGFTEAAGAAQLAEAARLAVQALQIPHADSTHGVVTISLGVASKVPRSADMAIDLVRAADAALFQAKQGGRNQVRCETSGERADGDHSGQAGPRSGP
jgi:diguanylate cyclase (GGDEF)-like protein